MKNLISTLRDAYDVVIIDSAPLMPVTDTRLLARLVDVSLFAVRWQKTPREAAKSALRLLTDTGVPIVGAVMTFVYMRRHALYGYGYGAAGYYGRYYSKYYED
ncbi:MAG: tyrosine-protein kinase family protein [Proteobacteria bacterium]|nr:MAG: tyrosine-protein kinase family protein [Pseudomonadota bacterium]